jgi:hypothetical protein
MMSVYIDTHGFVDLRTDGGVRSSFGKRARELLLYRDVPSSSAKRG